MLRSCKWCGRIHDDCYDCGRKPARKRMVASTEADAFRRTSAWKRKSLEIRYRDHGLCQVCLRGLYLSSRVFTYDSLSVHHIVPLSEDRSRALDDENLITLCGLHHELAESGYIPREDLLEMAAEAEAGVRVEHPG